jgi:shikimate kinase
MNIYLIGYRGTGKTTVAALLAERLGWPWHDADEEIERRAGCTIAEIFARSGEPGFRDLEAIVVAHLASLPQAVVSLGGGAILREENRRVIAGTGKTVWLQANVETIERRITADASTSQRRPNLTAQGGIEEIRRLLAAREPAYRQCAHITVNTEKKSPAVLADEILAALGLKSKN